MTVGDWTQVKRQSLKKIKEDIRLYSKVAILYQGKITKGTVIGIDLKGVKIKENTQNHTYKWKYVLGLVTQQSVSHSKYQK